MNISGIGQSIAESYNNEIGSLAASVERASKGTKYNKLSDGPNEKIQFDKAMARISAVGSVFSNIQQAYSAAQTASWGYGEISGLLGRINELASMSSADREIPYSRSDLQTKVDEHVTEIDRIAQNTEFNNIKLISGASNLQLKVQVTPDKGGTHTMTFVPATKTALGISSLNVRTQSSATSALTTISNALDTVGQGLAYMGGSEQALQAFINGESIAVEGVINFADSANGADPGTAAKDVALDVIQQNASYAVTSKESSLRVAVNKFFLESVMS